MTLVNILYLIIYFLKILTLTNEIK